MCNILIVWVFEVEVAYFVTCSNTVVGVVWCGVVWCGVVWCDVVLCVTMSVAEMADVDCLLFQMLL